MKVCTKCGVSKDLDEFYRHSAGKDRRRTTCKICFVAQTRAWQKNNHDRHAANCAAWAKTNPEKMASLQTAWYVKNKEEHCANSRARKKANPEKEKTNHTAWAKSNPGKVRESALRYQKAHPEKCAARAMKRHAGKLRATPTWADSRFIALWYKGARIMTQLVGRPYHVDHVVPLKSKLVCGLHVPANMQILSKPENIKKSNRYWPDMP